MLGVIENMLEGNADTKMWKSFKGFIKTFVDIVNDEREVNVDNWRRRNGWTWPPSVLQMLSWIALGFLIPISAILVAPLHPVFAPLFVFLFAIWIIALIIVITSIDPAIRTLRPGTKPARFDRSKHLHVIENLYCNICLITVDASCKHCRKCNKCVSGFDHHCKWLNNCIGVANYRLFLLLVSSASLTAFTMASVLTVLPIYFLISGADIRKSGGMLLPTTWWQGLCAVVVFTDSTVAFLSAYLLYFHCKLWQQGTTTYRLMKARAEQKQTQNETITGPVSLSLPVVTVAPTIRQTSTNTINAPAHHSTNHTSINISTEISKSDTDA